MKTRLIWTALAAAATAAVALRGGPEREAPPPPPAAAGEAIAYHAARIYADPAAPPLADAWLLVRDGKVAGVLDDAAALPPLTEVVELGDQVLFPGLVAADSTVTGAGGQGDHALGAQRRAFDSFDPWQDWSDALRRGVTTVYLSPDRARLIGGRGAVVKAAGTSRVLREVSDLRVDLTPAAFDPPTFYRPPIPPTSESPLKPPVIQPASSRAGALMVLREEGAAARAGTGAADFDPHRTALRAALQERVPLRVVAESAGEVRGALEIARAWDLPLVIEGGREAASVLGPDTSATLLFRVPLFEHVTERPLDAKFPAPDALAGMSGRAVAVCATEGRWYWLLEAASAAVGLGLDEAAARASITSAAAAALGVGDRVGRLAAGLDADFVVLNDDPLHPGATVRRVYVDGVLAWNEARVEGAGDAGVVVRAGTVWTGDGPPLTGGAEVLLRDGRIVAVGPRVPHPSGADIVDAGPEAHLTPGFIDARGQLGMGGRPDDSLLLGLVATGGRWDPEWAAVARAGITTMVVGPSAISRTGTRTQAVKTAAGPERAWIDGRELVLFDLRGGDHANRADDLRQVLEGGKHYAESWQKYREERAKWELEAAGKSTTERATRERELRLRLARGKAEEPAGEKQATGDEKKAEKPAGETEAAAEAKVDPVNGLWEATVEHEFLPEPIKVNMRMHHEGKRLVVLVSSPDFPEEEPQELEGSFEGDSVHVEIPTEMGTVRADGTIDAPDHMNVSVVLHGVGSVEFEAFRIQREEGGSAFATPKKRTKKDDGPQEPKRDWRNEGLRSLFEQSAVALVAAERPDEIRTAVALFGEFGLRMQVVGGSGAAEVADVLREQHIGVVVAPDLVQRDEAREVVPAASLHELGIATAFRSDAAGGARFLPQALALATRHGLGPEQALVGLTSGAADLLGLADRVGRLRAGLDGDLVVHSGPPFDLRSRVLRVFVNGREVPQE